MFLQWLVAIIQAWSFSLPFQSVLFMTNKREVLCKDAMKSALGAQRNILVVFICFSLQLVLLSEKVEYDTESLGLHFYDLRDSKPPEKQILGRLPCSCADLACGCCAGLSVRAYNFSRKACTNLTYDPYEFSLTMDMLINDNSVYSNSISGKNPPAMCIPIIIPYLPTTFHLCMRLFNIFTPGSNLHACMDWEARVANKPVLILHFDCMRIGYDGVALLKPEDNGGLEFPTNSPSPPGEDDVYDEILEEK